MTVWSDAALSGLASTFAEHADPVRAPAMAAYMRNLFPYFGIPSPDRRVLVREVLGGLPRPDEADLADLLSQSWRLPEREFQQTAGGVVAQHIRRCGPSFFAAIESAIRDKSWWDTVDGLAADCVGPLVLAHPSLAEMMDRWVEDPNPWVARTAIIHQLRFKAGTDTARLFGYCIARAPDTEFFLRKAIGWALREYSKTDPNSVVAFVAAHPELSPLSQREALKWLSIRSSGRAAATAAGITLP